MAWVIDPAHTTVGFKARHMGLSTVRGHFGKFDGAIELDPNDITTARGRVEVDLASVNTNNEQRDAHLRSPDFFDIERFPEMTFAVDSVVRDGEGYKVRGDLTIKDVTKPVEFDLQYTGEGIDPYGNRRIGGSLTGTIKRSDWGLTWNVALETGGWLVSDKITIEIEGQLAESREAADEQAEAEAVAS